MDALPICYMAIPASQVKLGMRQDTQSTILDCMLLDIHPLLAHGTISKNIDDCCL